MYTHMFELILRLKGNYLWPAMWGNVFNVDDPQNPVLADEYGIVMGTSHHEPLTRAHAGVGSSAAKAPGTTRPTPQPCKSSGAAASSAWAPAKTS